MRNAWPNLRTLSLPYAAASLEALIRRPADSNSALVELSASACRVLSGDALTAYLRNEVAAGSLNTLRLFGCNGIGPGTLGAVAAHCTALVELDAPPNISDDDLARIASGCPALRTLRLIGCHTVTDKGLQAVFGRASALESFSATGLHSYTLPVCGIVWAAAGTKEGQGLRRSGEKNI